MEEIDYFKGVTNQEFIDYYKVDLYSRMEFTLYTYPHEFAEEDPIPWEHFNRCEGILYEYLYNAYAAAQYHRWEQQKEKEYEISSADTHQTDSALEETAEEKAQKYAHQQNERERMVRLKMQELMPELNKMTNEYMKNVKLTFVDL